MQRIEKFLSEDEVEDWASALKRGDNFSSRIRHDSDLQIGFQQATFEWHAVTIPILPVGTDDDEITLGASGANTPTSSNAPRPPFSLRDINISFPIGKLSLITGRTGSGKSSLLAALLGEMDRTAGSVFCPKGGHKVALAGQFPFLEHATIRDNITYHSGYDKSRYGSVLEACALVPDLAILDAGDMTGW